MFFLQSYLNKFFTILSVFAIMIFLGCKKKEAVTIPPTPVVVPPSISTLTVSYITSLHAISGGNVTAEGTNPVTTKGIVWSISANPTISLNTKTSDGSGVGSFASALTGLTPNTTYYVRAYATTSAGTTYGNEISFNTNSIDINTGLVAFYPFTENTKDSSGNNNHGNSNGATLTSDRYGVANRAYDFNGSSTISASPTFAFTENQDFTVSCFAYLTSKSLSDPFVSYGNTATGNYVWYLGWYNSKVQWGVNKQGFTWSQTNTPKTSVMPNVNQWYHVLGVKNNKLLTLYINGVAVDSVTQVIQNPAITKLPLTMGGFAGTGQYLNGKLDDVRIYNRALTREEIVFLSKL